MNKSSGSVFSLIHSMTSNERGYFRRFLIADKRKGENTILLKLFNSMLLQKKYDEKGLLKKFKGQLTLNSFRNYKSELFKITELSLLAQGTRNTPQMQWRHQMNRVELLLGAGLHKEAAQLLHKMKNSIEHEQEHMRMMHKLEIYETEKIITQLNGSYNSDYIFMLLNAKEKTYNILALKSLEWFEFKLQKSVSHRLLSNNASDEKELENIYLSYCSYTAKNKRFCAIPAFVYYHKTGKVIYSYAKADFITGSGQGLALVEQLHAFYLMETRFKPLPADYFKAFILAVRLTFLSGDTAALKKLIDIATPGFYEFFAEDEYRLSFLSHSRLLLAYMKNAKEEMIQLSASAGAHGLRLKSENDMLRYRWFNTTLALAYFRMGNCKTALHHAHLVTQTDPHNRAEIHLCNFCNIFWFVIKQQLHLHEKKQADDSDMALVQSAISKLKKEKGPGNGSTDHSFELCLLHYFLNPTEASRILCIAEMQVLKQTLTAKHFNALFDFPAWMERIRQPLGHSLLATG